MAPEVRPESTKLVAVAPAVWVTRFCVKPLSVARLMRKPVWLVALLVQVRSASVPEAAVATRFDGAAGAVVMVQVWMFCVAVNPPVPPVNPTKAMLLPTVAGILML